MAKEEAAAEQPKSGGKKKLFIIILAVVLLVVLAGGGAAVYLLTSKPAAEQQEGHEQAAAEDEHPPVYEKLESFTVNLADGETYLQVEIQLQVADAKVQEKLKQRMPEVRNDIIRILSSKQPEELATLEGKDALAASILGKLNELLGAKKEAEGVKKVLFNAFIIQ